MQAYIKDCRNLAPLKTRKDALDKLIKARNPDLHYENL